MARGEAIGTTTAGMAIGMLVEPVVELSDAFFRAAQSMTEPSGLSPARWRVLSAVRDGAHAVPAIATRVRMGMSRQAVQRIADELVASGHARWRENPAHRRSMLLEPTEQGFAALDAIIARQVQWANAVGALLDTEDVPAAASLLHRVLHACTQVPRDEY